jgi:Flp pilus assembly protein CpaB
MASHPLRERLQRGHRAVRRAVLGRRRLLAGALTVVAVLAGFRAVTAPPAPTQPVTVFARDLPAGTVLGEGDLFTARFAPETAPDGLADQPVGRVLAAGVRRGEPITDARLLGPALVEGRPGLTAMPVRLPDAAMAALLRVGDHIDLLAADPQGGPASSVADAALVVALPRGSADTTADGLPGRLVVLGVAASDVPEVAQASVTHFLTYSYSGSDAG